MVRRGGPRKNAQKDEGEMDIDPALIRFTHSKISPVFSDGRMVADTLQEIVDGKLSPSELPKLLVIVEDKGKTSEKKEGESLCDNDTEAGETETGTFGRSEPQPNKRKNEENNRKKRNTVAKYNENNHYNYYSLNNRRLWVLKQAREKGLLKDNTVTVRTQVMPTSKRLKNKFSPSRCSLQATFLKEKPVTEMVEEDEIESSDTENGSSDDFAHLESQPRE